MFGALAIKALRSSRRTEPRRIQRKHKAERNRSTWQAQVSGVKTWFLEPPPECAASCPNHLQANLYPGDMIIVNTNFWMHKTNVLNEGISLVITQQIG